MSGLRKGIEVHKTPFAIFMKDSSSEDEGWQKAPSGTSKKKSSKKPQTGSSQTSHPPSTQSKASAKNTRRRAKKRQNAEVTASDTHINGEGMHENGPTQDLQCQNEAWMEEEFQRDLGEAIMQSKLEAERQPLIQDNADVAVSEARLNKSKKNKKGVVLSLQELHRTVGNEVHPETQVHPETKATSAATPPSDFFGQLDEDIHSELKKESVPVTRKVQSKQKKSSKPDSSDNDQGITESVRLAQLTTDLEKKDAEILKLDSKNKELENQLKEAKIRNQVLYKMLSKGEISSKSDLLQEIEHVSCVKEELTKEVERLHTELEQEKSKNKLLQVEMGKLQEVKKVR